MTRHTINVRLTAEQSKIRRDGGSEAEEMLKRVYDECSAKLSQSTYDDVEVKLWDGDVELETFYAADQDEP